MAPHTWFKLGDGVSDTTHEMYYRGQKIKEAYYRGEKILGKSGQFWGKVVNNRWFNIQCN